MFLHLRIHLALGVLLGGALLAGPAWPGATAGGPGEKPKPLTAAQQARLKEGDRLAAEAKKHYQMGQLAEAVAAWQKKLAIDREVYGDVHGQVVQAEGVVGVVLAQEALAQVVGLLVQSLGVCKAPEPVVLGGQIKRAENRIAVLLPQQLPSNRQRLAGQGQPFPRTASSPEGHRLTVQGGRLAEAPAALRR